MTAGHPAGAFSTDVHQRQVIEMRIITQALFVARMPVEAVLVEGSVTAFGDTGQALPPGFGQAPFFMRAGGGRQGHAGDEAAQSSAAARPGDEQVVDPESSQAGNVGDMFVRPPADEPLGVEIVSGWCDGCLMAGLFQEGFQTHVDGLDEAVGRHIAFGPGTSGKRCRFGVLASDAFPEGQKENNDGRGLGEEVPWHGVLRACYLPEPWEKGIVGSSDSQKRLPPVVVS